MHSSPNNRYRQLLAAGQITEDSAQRQAVALLDDLHRRLTQRRRSSWLSRWRTEGANGVGLYLWGGVGRGKTMLMDMFHDSLPVGPGHHGKLRLHFHRFMQQIHAELRRHAGVANPLQRIADDLAERASILCFDEFFVSDIGDAMILSELIQALFERRLTLVATSNVEPDKLYENGLQRSRFLPAIKALKQHTLVHLLASETDHRLRVLERAKIYHSPLNAEAESCLSASFSELAPDHSGGEAEVLVGNRAILGRRLAPDVVWFDFSELCEGPRSQNDYIELARYYHSVLVSNVKRMTAASENTARRFISLVDEFYDRNVKLIVSAEAPVQDLYAGEQLSFEFERTKSRLLEMQSRDYLAKPRKQDP